MCTRCGIAPKECCGKCRPCYNAYTNEKIKERYHRLRLEWIAKLGGACVECGTTENLEFDHIDASKKKYNIAKILSTHSRIKVAEEMAKCQLLCEDHHLIKTIREEDISIVEHGGGVSGKRNCLCDPCRLKKNEYMRNWKRKKRLDAQATSC